MQFRVMCLTGTTKGQVFKLYFDRHTGYHDGSPDCIRSVLGGP